MNTDDQTFSADHRTDLLRAFGGNLSIDTLGVLYRASYSATFAADLRQLMREIARDHEVDEWEGTTAGTGAARAGHHG